MVKGLEDEGTDVVGCDGTIEGALDGKMEDFALGTVEEDELAGKK